MELKKILLRSSLQCVGIVLAATQTAFAIELNNPAAAQAYIDPSDKEYVPMGVRAGGFRIFPAVEVGVRADDNIFRFPDIDLDTDPVVSDTIIDARASASINSDWNQHEFNAIASVDLGRYNDYDSEDYEDYVFAADGRLDIKRGSFLSGKAGYMLQHEDRSSLNSRRGTLASPAYGVNPTTYDFSYVGAAYDRQPAKIRTLVKVDYETLNYDDIKNVFGGIVDNSDRNRSKAEAVFRVGYENLPNRRIFIEGTINSRDYDRQFDNNGVERSSTGYRLATGMNFDLSNLLVGDIFIGYVEQDYDAPAQADISSGLVGFGLKWYPTRLTSLDLNLDRKVEETTETTASGYLSTIFSARVNHELKRNIILFGNVDYTDNEFEQNSAGQKENETITGFGLGGKYLFSRRWYTSVEYRHEERSSDLARQEYTDNQGLIAFGANW